MGDYLGLRYTEITPDSVRAHWRIRPEMHQPAGLVHGGVYCAVVESLASIAGMAWLGDRGHVVGVNNNTDFLRAAREGTLHAHAIPMHRGRLQQLWLVNIVDEQHRLIARGHVRLQNVADSANLAKPENNTTD
ncbi:PaaI family thioesterase [Hoyosella rhizosphaerae]|nr:PaaI family thioesterase [Hoyosella rhizosphaerae]MBN4927278.1 PaaI family thioesterase [Hoyosella rhizosphaerae]